MSALTSHWTLDPSLIYVGLAAVLYWVGGVREGSGGGPFRRASGAGRAKNERLLRELSFAGGLLTIPIALCSPIDYYSDQWFWVHMGQHILLLTVAPPLILLGRPWPRMWRAIPREVRTPLGRGLAQSPAAMPLRWLARPVPAWTLFNVDMLIWHVPKFYDLTLQYQWIHNCEHTLFFFTGLLFWAHIVDPGPIRARLNWALRTVYVIGAMIVGWILAIALVIDPKTLYSHYANLYHPPGGLTALGDQQVAGGMMWVAGSISYTVAVIYAFSRWVEPQAQPPARRAIEADRLPLSERALEPVAEPDPLPMAERATVAT
jgi:cytochrome c oxidase assembly factor CtaG